MVIAMLWSDYYAGGPVMMSEKTHECYLEGLTVICNNIQCSYREGFSTMDDAKTAMEIHEEGSTS